MLKTRIQICIIYSISYLFAIKVKTNYRINTVSDRWLGRSALDSAFARAASAFRQPGTSIFHQTAAAHAPAALHGAAGAGDVRRRHLRGLGLHRQVRYSRGPHVPQRLILSSSSPFRSLAASRSLAAVVTASQPRGPRRPRRRGRAHPHRRHLRPGLLSALATCARVVLSCAGLFRLHGHAVAAACAAVGADCLDISEEPEFMERVEAELHEPTARSGSLIVSACGFGFVPAEFGFLFHSRQWEVGTPLPAGYRGGVREPAGDVWFDESYSY
jgi:hypothetical protein